jgi:hypothetical protein
VVIYSPFIPLDEIVALPPTTTQEKPRRSGALVAST